MTLLFNLSMILVMPFWFMMIFVPRWRWTKRIIASPWVAIFPAIIYALVVVPRLPDVLLAFNPPTIDSLSVLLSSPSGVVITWAHFLAFDLLIGRWIYMDGLTHDLSPFLMAPILLLAFMLAPLGWLLYMFVRSFVADDLLHSPIENPPTANKAQESGTLSSSMKAIWQASLTYWHKTSAAQRVLFVTGTVLLLWMIAHIGLLIVGNRPVNGPTSFRKAATFAETGWLMCWAVGYALPYLKIGSLTRWFIVGGTWLFGAAETLLISVQVWRDVPSHYNFTTPLNSALFGTTGIIASIWLFSMIALLVALLRDNDFDLPMRLAYSVGTLLMIVGGITGFLMLFNLSGIYQGNFIQNAQTLIRGDMLGTFTADAAPDAGGNIVVLHALGVHGLSVLPLLAWLFTYTKLSKHNQLTLVMVGSIAYVALLLLMAIAAIRTIPLHELSTQLLSVNAVIGSILLMVYIVALWRGMPALLQHLVNHSKMTTATSH